MGGILFTNGRIYTLEPSSPLVEAVAVRDGRIAAIGRSADLRDSCSGFRRVDLAGTRSLVEAVGLVAAAVRRARPGTWVRGRG